MNIGRIIITLHNPGAGRLMESNREFWCCTAYLQDMQCHCSFANSAKGCNIFADPRTIFIVCREKSRVQIESDK